MARTVIPLQTISPATRYDVDVAWTAADSTNDHYIDNTSGAVLLLYKNDDAGPHTVTVSSVADSNGRTGNISQAVAAGKIAAFGPFPRELFNQIGASYLGQVFFDVDSDTSGYFAALKLPL